VVTVWSQRIDASTDRGGAGPNTADRAEIEWELAGQGRVPRSPLEAAAEAHAAQDRVDRRQEAAERRLAEEEGRPPKLAGIVDREIAASEAEFLAKPASVADLAYATEQTNKKFAALARFIAGRP
jgi:hypothetical protein